ncbi:hypothetical protein EZS27_035831, partial [termite gut metagenome]
QAKRIKGIVCRFPGQTNSLVQEAVSHFYQKYQSIVQCGKKKEDFSKQKIIFQEMVQESSFMFDKEGAFFCLDTGRIIIGENIEYLISILNSRLFFFAVKKFYGGGGLGALGVRMKHTFFDRFSIPILNTDKQTIFVNLVNTLINDFVATVIC